MTAAFIAAAAALVATAALQPLNLRLLRRFHFGVVHTLREDIDNRAFVALHARKAGLLDAGGAMGMGVAFIALLALWEPETRAAAAAIAGFGLIGLVDDVTKARRRRGGSGRDLGALPKLVMETAAGAFAGWAVYAAGTRDQTLPIVDEVAFGLWIIPVTAVAAIALSNAVNITDGLDGLAGGLLLMSMGALALAAGLTDRNEAMAMALVAIAVLLPFLYLNRHPAKIIMGDAGALGAGALLAVTGVMADQLVLLFFVSVVYLAEAASSFIQVVALRLGRRIFRIAPLHHHLEAIGWPETRITPALWLTGLASAAAGLAVSAGLGYL